MIAFSAIIKRKQRFLFIMHLDRHSDARYIWWEIKTKEDCTVHLQLKMRKQLSEERQLSNRPLPEVKIKTVGYSFTVCSQGVAPSGQDRKTKILSFSPKYSWLLYLINLSKVLNNLFTQFFYVIRSFGPNTASTIQFHHRRSTYRSTN